MSVEVERRFMVTDLAAALAGSTVSFAMVQGYLSTDPVNVVRVREDGEEGWLTVKGLASPDGRSRREDEVRIGLEAARAAMTLCAHRVEKVRHVVPFGDLLWEVDVFGGANAGLVVAEVELDAPDDALEVPPWAGREVTGETWLSNVALAVRPRSLWDGGGPGPGTGGGPAGGPA